MEVDRNRLANADNRFQGTRKRVLTVCSAGLLRSPTAAWILSNDPFNFNTRSCGASADFALVVLDPVLVSWADAIVCMNTDQADKVEGMIQSLPDHFHRGEKQVIVLNVPDNFGFRDPELVTIMTDKLTQAFKNDLKVGVDMLKVEPDHVVSIYS